MFDVEYSNYMFIRSRFVMIVENKPNNGKYLINMGREMYEHFRHKTEEFNANNENK
jgi:hypothetical protein